MRPPRLTVFFLSLNPVLATVTD